jgi:hypothetical protein
MGPLAGLQLAAKVSTLQRSVLLLQFVGTQVRLLASCILLRPRNLSSDVPGQMNLTRKPLGGRDSHLAGETTDVETGIQSSGFLKPGTGEYLTSPAGKSQNFPFSPRDFLTVFLADLPTGGSQAFY